MSAVADFLKGLGIDIYYKVFIYLGVALSFLALVTDIKVITNSQALLFGVGFFLIGLGEWQNIVREYQVIPPNIYLGGQAIQLTITKWKPKLLGLTLDLLGLFLFYCAINSILNYPWYQPLLTPVITPIP